MALEFSGLQGSFAKGAREAAEQGEAERQQLQKTHDRELKAMVTRYKKQQVEATRVARQHAAEELAVALALKKLQREAATSRKSHGTANKAK
jgi:hypothetical protein